MIDYVKHFDSNKAMSFKVIDNKILKKYNKIWEEISSLMNIEFDSGTVYGDGDKYIKTKIKMHEGRVILLLERIKSIVHKHFCKYVIRKNKMGDLINGDLDLSSSDESDNESDNEYDNFDNGEPSN